MKKFILVLSLLGTFIFIGCTSNNSNMEKKEISEKMMKKEMHGNMEKKEMHEEMMKKDKM